MSSADPGVVMARTCSDGEETSLCLLKNPGFLFTNTDVQCSCSLLDYLQHGVTTCVITCDLYCQLGVKKASRVRQIVPFLLF
ncbi:hypothetical protein DPMN_022650 [Dreissena polymorpha]|uniref:Uncharacterized protein n=1 Tax=Dreissena polymorpha TaxID=45954 RepID=A0A9D4NPN5_DREPO|nr:hypothetical protein DPMN_022650 [Dreissena polymorpha]